MTDWKNRIISHGVKPASDFLANPDNPRVHPQTQRDAMRGSLDSLGWIAPVIELTNGYLLDGHERIFQALDQGDDTPVPYIVVDLAEHEIALALASFDFITTMANYDRDRLNMLLQEVKTDNPTLQSMLSEMAKSHGLYETINPRDEWQGMPEFEQEALSKYKTIQVVFQTEDAMKAFARLVGQTITDKTGMIYYPARQQPEAEIYRMNESDES